MSSSRKFNVVAFDLETIADKHILELFPDIEVKTGNTKDPEKIKAKIKTAKQARVEKMGLNPHENMVCLFTWTNGNDSGHILLEEESPEAEGELLLQAWEVLSQYEMFITFNGIQFDVPILNLHSMFRKVRPSVAISTAKYSISNHIDLRMILGNWDTYAPGKLDYYLARCLGRRKMEGVDGAMVQHMWDVGMKDEIVEYGVKDAVDTLDLYLYAREYYPGLY